MVKLVKFKEHYGISLSAMIYTRSAQQTNILKESEAKWLWIEFSKAGMQG